MNKSFYKCATCIHHKVNLEEEKCICILEKLNPKRKDMEHTDYFSVYHGTGIVVSGGVPFIETRHYHQWICIHNYKFLNCPGYKKDET